MQHGSQMQLLQQSGQTKSNLVKAADTGNNSSHTVLHLATAAVAMLVGLLQVLS